MSSRITAQYTTTKLVLHGDCWGFRLKQGSATNSDEHSVFVYIVVIRFLKDKIIDKVRMEERLLMSARKIWILKKSPTPRKGAKNIVF